MKTNLTYYKRVFSDVTKNNFVSLYLLKGSEGFIMEEMAKRITSAIVPDDLKAFNLAVAHGSEIDIDEFVATASSFPFLSDHRVLILRELEKLRGSWKKLIEYCENPAPTSVVIFLYNPFDEWKAKVRPPRDYAKLEAAVKKRGRAIEFDRLSGEDLRIWVGQTGKRMGVELDAGAAETLIQSVGENLFELQNELAKLSLLFPERLVRTADLASVIGSYRLGGLYELIDQIRPGKGADALAILQRIVRTGAERPSVILYQLTRHFLALLKLKMGSGREGYVHESVRRKASVFSVREIVVWLENLRRAELALKTSSFPEEALLVGVFVHALNGSCMEYPATSA